MSWLEYYDKIYAMEDGPSDDVINSDEALESFLRQKQYESDKIERQQKASSSASGGKSTMKLI